MSVDRAIELAYNAEQALRFQKMYAAVILACIDEAIDDNVKSEKRTFKEHEQVRLNALEYVFLREFAEELKENKSFMYGLGSGTSRGPKKSEQELIDMLMLRDVDFLATFKEDPLPDFPLIGTDNFMRWVSTTDGDMTFHYACIEKSDRTTAAMEEFINSGIRTASLMGLIKQSEEDASTAEEAELEDA